MLNKITGWNRVLIGRMAPWMWLLGSITLFIAADRVHSAFVVLGWLSMIIWIVECVRQLLEQWNEKKVIGH